MKRVTNDSDMRKLISQELERTGGVFRLAPCWVGRPGIIQPGRRIKLRDIFFSQDVAVNERWLASTTYADNGVYNAVCPEDHGLSYAVIGEAKVQLKDAFGIMGDVLLGPDRDWDVLPKFFDNQHRIPHHLHPCDKHVRGDLTGKPESYYFPPELNLNPNAFATTYLGIDPAVSDKQVARHIEMYFKGDNRLTDISNVINLVPGMGIYMPPCTLHAPGSLVTYELQVASDVTCIPESRVNDMPMPPDLLDRDLPVTVKKDGQQRVFEYILEMIRCPDSGNRDNFREEYLRPPVTIRKTAEGSQQWIIYRNGRKSEPVNKDYYSAKRTTVQPGQKLILEENAAFGVIVLRGHGKIQVAGKPAVSIESPSMYDRRDQIGGDEVFLAKDAAKKFEVTCESCEPLTFCQHFASNSNPESTKIEVPEYLPFEV